MEMFRQRYILHFLLPSTRRRLLADSFNLQYILVQHKVARLQDSVIKGTVKGILSLSTPLIPT